MRNRSELTVEVEKRNKQTIEYIENKIVEALALKQVSIQYHCNEEEYLHLKHDIEYAGFRTKYFNVRSRVHSPYMEIYL